MIRGAGRLRRYTDEPVCCANENGYWCTLPPGHAGRHEAHAGPLGLLAVWGDVVRDGRHLFENDGGMPDETLALRESIRRWHGSEMNGLARIAKDIARRGPCPGCGAPPFDGRDGAFCNDDCRSMVIMLGADEQFADAAEARRLTGCE